MSPELAAALSELLSGPAPDADGYEINRRTFYPGRWVRYAWYPEWRMRLVRRETARWQGRDPHDRLEVSGRTARLNGDLLHYSYKDLRDHLERALRYARTSADGLACAGKCWRWHHLVLSPWAAMIKRLIVKQGFRDGWRGWIIAVSTFLSVFAKYAFLFERQLEDKGMTKTESTARPPRRSRKNRNAAGRSARRR